MVEFTLSKELRSLAVAEFTVLISKLVLGGCSNGEDGGCLPEAVSGAINDTFSVLESSIYCALLVLLSQQVAVCNDPLLRHVLLVAVILFSFQVLSLVINLISPSVKVCLSRWRDDDVADEENQATNFHFTSDSDINQTNHTVDCTECCGCGCAEQCTDIFSKLFGVIFAALASCMCVFVLAGFALAIFCLATTIKLAIPSEYTAKCADNSPASKLIMVGILVSAIFIQSSTWILTLLAAASKKMSASFRTFYAVVELLLTSALIPAAILASALGIWLFIHLTKVWRGFEPQLYEFFALGICVPLLSP